MHPYCRNFSTCHQQSPLFIRFFYKDELKNEIAELHYREIGASDSEEIVISRKLRLKNFCYEQVYFLHVKKEAIEFGGKVISRVGIKAFESIHLWLLFYTQN